MAIQAFRLSRKGLYALVGLSLVLSLLASVSTAQALELTAYSITLGDSKPSTAGNWRFAFTTATGITGDTTDNNTDMKFVLRFPSANNFTIAAGLVNADIVITGLPTGGAIVTADGVVETSNTITIDVDLTNVSSAATLAASTIVTVDVINDKITNPAKTAAAGTADLYDVSAETQNASSVVQDTGSSRVAIQDAQSVSATVNTVLTFTITGVANAANCIGTGPRTNNTGAASTTTTIPFGVLEPLSRHQTCQSLAIATNAPSGYSLFVVQNGNLIAGSDDIDQFKDGTRIDESASTAWTAPAVSAQSEVTHGHLGYSSNDADVFSSADNFAGVPTGPASGAAPVTTGLACKNTAATTGDTCLVEFDVEISALQPAGSYTAEFQYIVVPTY
jgi:hypothetical protein